MNKLISLKVNCPHCGKSLMDYTQFVNFKPSIKAIVESKGDKGTVHLCSLYGCYDHESDIDLAKGELVDYSCTHCKTGLNSKNQCDVCGAGMVKFDLEKGGKVMICSRQGCENHYVAFEDIYDALTRFYDEYEYGSPEGMSQF